MKKRWILIVVLVSSLSLLGFAQASRIVIGAGTPEDKALQTISAETDAQKRLVLLEQFNKDFASNPSAVAYGYWQMLQAYQGLSQFDKAIASGEKAMELAPGNLEILSSLCGVAQISQEFGKMVDYAARGGKAFNGIATQPKPADMSAQDWASRIEQDQTSYRQSYEYLEAAAVNAIGNENDPKKRLAMIEKFTPAFPNSKFEVEISQFTMAALQGLNDPAKSIQFGEKALKANPDNVSTLLLLANAYVDENKNLAKAVEYGQKAVKLSSATAATPDSSPDQKLTAGMAKSTLGWAYLKQDKAALAAPELKDATSLLSENAGLLEEAYYRAGFAYAKLGKKAEAQDALQKCIAMKGPFLKYAQQLLAEVNALGKKKR
jgi:tetratricopeptide (TPR) repeat protein